MKRQQKKDVLIALMNNRSDFRIAQEDRWYRIPVKSAPENVRDRSVRYLAFYHTKIFGDQAFSIRWFGEVHRITVVQRRELFPNLEGDPKAEREYFKIEFHDLRLLPEPIISRRLRRILFISTTFIRFQQAKEINDVFHESPIEEIFWEALRAEQIEAERQYMVGTGSRFFYLDFALFCRERNIDIECNVLPPMNFAITWKTSSGKRKRRSTGMAGCSTRTIREPFGAWLWSRANKSACLSRACRAAADFTFGGRLAGESERNHERNLL